MTSSEMDLTAANQELEAFDVTGAFLVSLKTAQQELQQTCIDTVVELRRRGFPGAFAGNIGTVNMVPGKYFWSSHREELDLKETVLWSLGRSTRLTGTSEIATFDHRPSYDKWLHTIVDIETIRSIERLKELKAAALSLLRN